MIANGLRGPWVPQVPAGGWADGPALVAAPPPELGRERGGADQGSGRSWPRPTPGDPQHPFPALHPGGGGPARAPRAPRTHWPSPAAASAAASARSPRPPPSPPAPAPAPSPWRRGARSDAALGALGGSDAAAAPRLRSHPFQPALPAPPAAQGSPRVRVRVRARARAEGSGSDWGWGSDAEGRMARHGRGAAQGREPAAAAGTRWRAASEPPPGRLGPLPRPLTSVSPRRPRARLRGSAPALALPPPTPDAPSPRLGARVRLGLCGQRGSEDDRRGQRTVRRGAGRGAPTRRRRRKAKPRRGFSRLRDLRGRDSEAVGGRGVGHQCHRCRPSRGCQTFLARGSCGRC